MKTILIAGGGGFIGLNLTKRLLTIGDPDIQIVILDNFKTSSRKNLEKICGDSSPERIDVFDVDITKASELDFLKTMYTCITEIYHLASIASPVGYSQFPLETLEAGYTGTKNLLDLAASLDSKPRFLFASSSEVYGQPLVHPQPESYYGNVNPYGTRSCYDTSKRVGETLVWIYHNTSTEGDGNRPCSGDLRSTLPPTDSVDTRIVRIFNTYGPYMSLNDGRIVTEIIKAAINGTVLKIFGDGNQTRCFSYIDDTIDSILTVMESNYTDPVNVGNDSEITVNQLVELFEVIVGRRINKEYTNIDKDDPLLRKPDLTVLNSLYFNTKCTHKVFTPIQSGLSSTYLYFLNKIR